ncbi:indolepyruvate oxidoreductase subunit beta family protein [Tsukamurella pseudospumae]|nr:indolepyruvate oxidoreductase subunit beta family protein [Tsukamurella pseudospumae]
MSWTTGQRPITVAVLAMGGEGGGVLADWIVSLGEDEGWTAQNTSVAGVAQRTGATVYYAELFPPDVAHRSGTGRARDTPILSLMPTPGEVDVLIASELMEAGRAVQRGFVTPDRTTLITSLNRVYSILEKSTLDDGRVDSGALLDGAVAAAKTLIAGDFATLARDNGSVISASLFGALAGSGALPFPRADFEEAIRRGGKGVETSLAAFAAGYERARESLAESDGAPSVAPRPASTPVPLTLQVRRPKTPEELKAEREEERNEIAVRTPESLVGPALADRARRVARSFPRAAASMLLHGLERTAVYQDLAYADRYLDRVARISALDADHEGAARLTVEAARHIALWMSYQDTVHVALQKVRGRRMDRVRSEVRPDDEQVMRVHEYLHPQVDEITDTLPTALGRALEHNRAFAKAVDTVCHRGFVINTTSVWGYATLSTLARMRPLRTRSLRFGREQVFIDTWLDTVTSVGRTDPALATEVVVAARVLKGYGRTHAHGVDSFGLLMEGLELVRGRPDAADRMRRLVDAAVADEDGGALGTALAALRGAAA